MKDENLRIVRVDPMRLGAGDIGRSYSADRIAANGTIRKPFIWQGRYWVSVGAVISGREGVIEVKAVELIPAEAWTGASWTYETKPREPAGHMSYTGIQVRQSGHPFVIGPRRALFKPGELSGMVPGQMRFVFHGQAGGRPAQNRTLPPGSEAVGNIGP